ncbi:epoxide hydrolase EphM [Nibrella viscosa]|uniref:Epoxide hydrolase EphM n=1 Tax=Nibrella viscosa TaxID=1084524 RepID=A0ABP8KL96_9BACT
MEHHFIPTNGIRLHVVQAGPVDGPLVILLHGFPEFWYGWRRQITVLAEAGYRVWAPDQRGYNLSDKPEGVGAYQTDTLVADILGLITASGRQKVFLVGHDWGAIVAWRLAARHPERLHKLVILNVPHWRVMKQFVLRQPRQLVRSWYIIFFQLPWIPETLVKWRNYRLMVQALLGTSRPGTFRRDDLKQYKQAWGQPNAFRSMINWYRAAVRKPPTERIKPTIQVPTLILWGKQDRFLMAEMARQSLAYCAEGELVYVEEATHWLQHEEAARVNTALIDFFARFGPL